MTTPQTLRTAWDLIGFDGDGAQVRVAGGRALYESVDYNDARGGRTVRLARLDATAQGLRVIVRYVDPDTVLEVVPDRDTTCPNGHAIDDGHFECPACGADRPSPSGPPSTLADRLLRELRSVNCDHTGSLAAVLGANRSTVLRTLYRMEEQGLVTGTLHDERNTGGRKRIYWTPASQDVPA